MVLPSCHYTGQASREPDSTDQDRSEAGTLSHAGLPPGWDHQTQHRQPHCQVSRTSTGQ